MDDTSALQTWLVGGVLLILIALVSFGAKASVDGADKVTYKWVAIIAAATIGVIAALLVRPP